MTKPPEKPTSAAAPWMALQRMPAGANKAELQANHVGPDPLAVSVSERRLLRAGASPPPTRDDALPGCLAVGACIETGRVPAPPQRRLTSRASLIRPGVLGDGSRPRTVPAMKVLQSLQREDISDAVRAKFAMVAPILEATLLSLAVDRVERLGGQELVTLQDLAREFRQGSGDAGICFEYAVHEAIATHNSLIEPLASEVLADLCSIDGGAASILFGPEKDGRIPIVESVQNALTDDSRLYVGNAGHPPKLKRYIPKIVRAFYRHEERNKLPRSINGLWKADLFLGNTNSDRWVGTTVKINPNALVGARGLRIGIYPKANAKDTPRKDEALNLIRLPLPYDAQFMELFYKSFNLSYARSCAPTPMSRALSIFPTPKTATSQANWPLGGSSHLSRFSRSCATCRRKVCLRRARWRSSTSQQLCPHRRDSTSNRRAGLVRNR